jgi:hypothetical protein
VLENIRRGNSARRHTASRGIARRPRGTARNAAISTVTTSPKIDSVDPVPKKVPPS